MATVYAVASAKGGVGKTTTTAAIATILADAGADVVAVDADIGMANLAGAIGVEPGEITLHNVLSGRADPNDAVQEGPAGLRVVPGATDLDAYAAADPSGLREVVAAFDDADYVFLDAGAGLSHDSTLPLGLADETLLVSTAERNALGDTEKTRQLTERLGGTVAGVAITRVGADGATDDEITRTLDALVLGRIPDDPAVLRAATADEPLPAVAPTAPATRAYRELARTLTGAEIPEPAPDTVGSESADATEPSPTDATETETTDSAWSKLASGRDEEGDKAEPSDKTIDEVEEPESDDDGQPADTSTEDIIVADADSGGLSEPTGERDIIIADESSVPDDEDDTDTDSTESAHGDFERSDNVDDPESDSPERGDHLDDLDADTHTVGDDYVDGDDLEAMIEDEAGEAAFDPERGPADNESADHESADSDSEAARVAEKRSEGESGEEKSEEEESTDDTPDATGPDIDDEFAGSIPFRDDDTETMNTVLSERSDSDEQQDATDGNDKTDDRGEGDDAEDDKDGNGFFSRLFGR